MWPVVFIQLYAWLLGSRQAQEIIAIMNREGWVAAILETPSLLGHAPPELQGDHELVMQVVAVDGTALMNATEELQGDHEIARRAVESSWEALRYIGQALRDDEALIRCGMRQSLAALACGSRALRFQMMAEVVEESLRRGCRFHAVFFFVSE